jgi:hypothetical protein
VASGWVSIILALEIQAARWETERPVGADHTFEIRFQDPGVQAYSFTFG